MHNKFGAFRKIYSRVPTISLRNVRPQKHDTLLCLFGLKNPNRTTIAPPLVRRTNQPAENSTGTIDTDVACTILGLDEKIYHFFSVPTTGSRSVPTEGITLVHTVLARTPFEFGSFCIGLTKQNLDHNRRFVR